MKDTNSLQLTDLDRFPIRVLSEKTRVGTSTLRAWERRFGLLSPERTPKGHRLYSTSDIQRVDKITRMLENGHSLGQIAQILKEAPARTESLDITELNPTQAGGSIWHEFIEKSLEAASEFNMQRIDAIYNEASSLYPADMVTERLILPCLEFLGKTWVEQPERGIAEEHFYTSWLKNRIGARLHHAYQNARGTRIIAACMPGNFHEIGLLLFTLSALNRGYRVLYFGADLPLQQLIHVARHATAKGVVLAAQDTPDNELSEELTRVVLSLDIPVFLGGVPGTTSLESFESAGGVVLGEKIPVALRVLERKIPAYPNNRTG